MIRGKDDLDISMLLLIIKLDITKVLLISRTVRVGFPLDSTMCNGS